MALIEIRNLVMEFGERRLLDKLNLTIEEGTSVVLAGPSGTGKSVLMKLCIGLLCPTAGQILIEGEDVCQMDELTLDRMRMKMGMLFQNYGLFDSMTVGENVGFFLYRHTKLAAAEIRQRVTHVLRQVDLEGVEDLKPVELSGGMKKRVGIARAIVHNPKIVFYDEPTAGLDPITADLINELIIDMRRQYQVTTLSISNDMSCAYKIGDKVAIVYDGRIVAIDDPDRVRQSTDPIVYQFVHGLEEGPIDVF